MTSRNSRIALGVGIVGGIAIAGALAAKQGCSRTATRAGREGWKPRGVRLADDIEAIRRNTDRMLEVLADDRDREAIATG